MINENDTVKVKHKKQEKELEQSFKDSLKNINWGKFSAMGTAKSSSRNAPSINSLISKTDLLNWMEDPTLNNKELRDASRLFYIADSLYRQTIQYYTDLLTLDYLLLPNFEDFDESDLDKIAKSKAKSREFLSGMTRKSKVREIIKTAIKNGVFFGYERKEGKSSYIQTLPADYCREGAIINGFYSIEFDTSYFDNAESKLLLYDKSFEKLWRKARNEGEKWQQLDPEYSLCIPMELSDFNFPTFVGSIVDGLDLDDFYKYMKQTLENQVSKILVQLAPLDEKTGQPLVDPEVLLFFQNAIAKTLDDNVKVVSTPFKVDTISFNKSKSSDAGLSSVDTMKAKASGGLGLAQAVIGNDKSTAGLKYNHENNVGFVLGIIEKFEEWINHRLSSIGNRKFGFQIGYLPSSRSNRGEIFDGSNALLNVGGSIMVAIASLGIDPDNYMAQVKLEKLTRLKDELEVPNSVWTTSSKEDAKGRPKSKDVDLTDSGDQTRDDGVTE